MWFLIGVLILITFVCVLIFYVRIKTRKVLDKAGFSGMNLSDIIKEARLEDQEVPKSLSSMDSIYLNNIKRDFPNLNINELKSSAEKVILDVFNSVEVKNSAGLKGKVKSFADEMLNDYRNKNVKFNNFKFHNTVVSKYSNDRGIATITFGSSFEYYLNIDGKSVKTQDRARIEYIYIVDIDKVPANLKVLGINCPNCGSPIKKLGEKTCSYCGSAVNEVFVRVFTCNNIVRY